MALTNSKFGLKTKSARVWRAGELPAFFTVIVCVKVSPGMTELPETFVAAASEAATTLIEPSETFIIW